MGSTTTLEEPHVEPEKDVHSNDSASVQSEKHETDAGESTGKVVGDEEMGPAAPEPVNPMHPSQFPDGGLEAWLVVAGASCALFVSFGWINCIGVFQDYYQNHQLKQYSPSTVAWISSLTACFMFLGGSWVGRLYDNFGPRYIILTGSFLHVFGLMMASISTEYYQLLLSQGICSPIGASMIFYPAFSAVVTWFYHKRAIAIGAAAAGSSLGGVIFPIMVERLVQEIGFGWTMRACAFMILALLVIANLLIKSRIPPRPTPVKISDFVRPLTEIPFLLLTLGMFFYFLGLFLPFTFIILEAVNKGMSPRLAGYLVSILNGASVFGRTFPAWVGDKIGRFNVMVVMSYMTSIVVLALWIPASSNAALIVFAVLFGFSSGASVSLPPALVAQVSDVRQIGVRTGTVFTFVAIAVLIGNPIGGQLITSDHGGYVKLQIFAGCTMLAGSTIILLARVRLAGWKVMTKV